MQSALSFSDPTNGRQSIEELLSLTFVFAAVSCCLLVLAGWILDAPGLSTFGATSKMRPHTAVSLLVIAFALLALMKGRQGIALCLLAWPLIFSVGRLGRFYLSIPFSLDQAIYTEPVHNSCMMRGGVPPTVAVGVMAFATALATRKGETANRLVILIASMTAAFALLCSMVFPLSVNSLNSCELYLFMSVPTGLATILLAFALILWRHNHAWPGLISQYSAGAGWIRISFLAWVFTPILIALAMLWLSRHSGMPSPSLSLLQTITQSTISILLLFWAWSRALHAHAARQKLAQALDLAPIAVTDADGRILHWSKGCERLYHWTSEEAVGQLKHQLLRTRYLNEALPGEGSPIRTAEIVEYRKDGSRIDIYEQSQGEATDTEGVTVMSMTDITARKRAEAAWRATDARLALAVEAHGIGIFEWDALSDRMSMTGEAQRLLGIAVHDFAGGYDAWAGLLASRFENHLIPDRLTLLDRRPHHFAFLLRTTDPTLSPHLLEVSVRCFYQPDGTFARLIGVLFDASDHYRRAMDLEVREAELRSILETVPEALITTNENGVIRTFSPTAERMFGYDQSTIIGQGILMLISDSDASHHISFNTHMAQSRKEHANSTLRLMCLTRTGTELPVELSVGKVHVGDEQIFTFFLRDLSDQMAGEARMSELREALLHVSRLSAMGEMAAGLAHELNQPLAAMSNYLGAAQILFEEDRTDHSTVSEFLRLSARQSLRAGEIIRRIRTFASSGDAEFSVQRIDELIMDAADLALTNAERRNISLSYDIDPFHAQVLVDRVQIQQVLVNLLRNTVEAMSDMTDKQMQIHVEVHTVSAGMIEVTVRDNGPGIAEDVLQRPHERFVSTKSQGMGIGLSICRRIIEAHRGHMHVGNHIGGGAEIRFTLPSFAHSEAAVQ